MLLYLTVALICMFGALVQSVVGFGAGLISMALLSLIWPVQVATLVMAPLSLVMTSALAWRLRESIDLKALTPLFFGLPFGVALGGAAYEALPVQTLRVGLGVLLICAAIYHGFAHRWSLRAPQWIGPLFGVISGVTGTSLSSPGPPAIIYGTLMSWPPREFRANLSLFFLISGGCTVLLLAVRGHLSLDRLGFSLSLVPAILIGVHQGSALADKVSQAIFKRLTLGLLLALGLSLALLR